MNFAKQFATFVMATLLTLPALANSLEDAKAAGHIGEMSTGYLGVVSGAASAEVQQLVDAINEKRRSSYARIAADNGVAIGAIEQRAAERVRRDVVKPGEFYNDGSGWERL